MAYLNLDPDYCQHPKTTRLEQILGLCTSIYPIKLWCWCAKYSKETGVLTGMNSSGIEIIIGWNATPGVACSALVECGFLEQDGEKYRVHDWKNIQGHLIAFSIRGKRNAKARWKEIQQKPRESCNASSNATTMPNSCKIDAPNLTKPDLTKPDTYNAGKPRNVFQVPTIEQITAYCLERKNNVNPELFRDHYTANGWVVGRNKMKDWQASVRTWEKSNGFKAEEKPKSSAIPAFSGASVCMDCGRTVKDCEKRCDACQKAVI
jgi:hypothetical protein